MLPGAVKWRTAAAASGSSRWRWQLFPAAAFRPSNSRRGAQSAAATAAPSRTSSSYLLGSSLPQHSSFGAQVKRDFGAQIVAGQVMIDYLSVFLKGTPLQQRKRRAGLSHQHPGCPGHSWPALCPTAAFNFVRSPSPSGQITLEQQHTGFAMATEPARAPTSEATAGSAPSDAQQLLPDLPGAAVACIFKHVPLQQRLTSCALVCRAWAAAAAAVPAGVSIHLRSSEHCRQLQDWLAKHAGVVVSLINMPDLIGYDDDPYPWVRWSPLQLPVHKLTRLRSLDLSCLKVQSAQGVSTPSSGSASSGSSDVAAAVLPQLQELDLFEVQLSVELLSQLLSATGLTSLDWSSVFLCSEMSPSAEDLPQEQVLAVMWQHLQLLPKLSKLKLHINRLTLADSVSETISPLSTLQHLHHFSFRGDQPAPVYSVVHRAVAKALLAALQHLTQLQHLELRGCHLDWATFQQGMGYQFFSFLTASTQLTALAVNGGFGVPVPQVAFYHMFPSGRVLPNLKALRLERLAHFTTDLCVEAAQVARIATSCPALQEVKLSGVTHPAFDTSCLAQLPPGVTRVEGLDWVRPTP